MSDKTPSELAKSYLGALENRVDDDEYAKAMDRRTALQDRLERFEENYGEADPATEELREKVEAADGRVAELEKERQEPEEAKRELLDGATGFMLDEDWLQPEVIQALNLALTGEVSEALLVEETELRGPEDADTLEDVDRYDVIDIIRRIAMDKVSDSEDFRDMWMSIEGSTKEAPFRVIAEEGRATPKEVAEKLDEDIDRKTVNNRLTNAIHQMDITPYHREDGTYSLSTAGKHIATKYADVAGAMVETEENEEEETEQNDDGQTTLVDGVTAANGGGADE